MQENKQTYGASKAHRRPESVQRGNKASNNRVSSVSQGTHTQSTQTGGNGARQNYRFQAEPVRKGSAKRPVTSDRSETGRRPRLDPKELKKRQKAQRKKAEKERFQASVVEYKERKRGRFLVRQQKKQKIDSVWQRDIVRVYGGVDKVMLGLILTLVCLGTIMVFSASYPAALNEGYDMYYYSRRQIVFVIIGLIGMFVISRIPYTVYKTDWVILLGYAGTCVLLVLVLLVGISEGEAKRWLNIGIGTIQPSELMKVVLILIEAWYIDDKKPLIQDRLNRKNTILYNVVFPCAFIAIACGLILAEKHMSGTLITGLLGIAVMIAGGCSIGWNLAILSPAAIIVAIGYFFLNPYAWKRVTSFFDKNVNLLDDGYQTIQGIYAIGSGGLFGLGLGHSRQKYSYVAAAHTDFIFSIWCEEMGFLGALFLVGLYLAFVLRGYTIASRAPDTFSSLVAYGISTHVGLQAVLNICVVTKIVPNTGISLPFFSYGGTSLVVLLCEMGILLSISRQYYMKRKDLEELSRGA